MSLYDKASLVQIPSGTKDGTLYSVLPANGNGDFTHTRASSATRVNKDGLIESVASDVPRLDYPLIDGVVQSCPALLLEPSRTNMLSYSEDFSQSTRWLVSSMTITTDDAVAPDGNQTADKAEATGAGSIRTNNAYTVTSGYSFSIFVKKGNSRYVTLRSFAFTTSAIIGFDLDTETAQTGGVIEKYPNDWYRLSISKDVSSDADKNGYFYIYLPNSLGSTTTVSGNYAYFWGAQLEDADYHTSYIPVLGLSSVTRSADECSGAGTSAEFNDTESSFFVEIEGFEDGNTSKYVSITDGGGSPYTNSVCIQYRNDGNLRVFHNGLDFADAICIVDIDQTVNHKIAVRYKENDMAVYIDGVSQTIRASFVYQTISGLNELTFGQPSFTYINPFYGKSRQVMVFNETLTDSELENISSWTSFGEMAKGQLYTIE
jgi:hypothetical protein